MKDTVNKIRRQTKIREKIFASHISDDLYTGYVINPNTSIIPNSQVQKFTKYLDTSTKKIYGL